MDAPTQAQKTAAKAPKCPTSARWPDGRTVTAKNGPIAPERLISAPERIDKEIEQFNTAEYRQDKRVIVYTDPETKARLVAYAKQKGRSQSEIAATILRLALTPKSEGERK